MYKWLLTSQFTQWKVARNEDPPGAMTTPHTQIPISNTSPCENEPKLFTQMAEFRSGADRYKRSLENLLTASIKEAFDMMDRGVSHITGTQEPAWRGFPGQI